MEAAWPWLGEEWRARVLAIGEGHAPIAGELAALEAVLAEIREEDFCGEDPMGENVTALLAAARFAAGSSRAGGAMPGICWHRRAGEGMAAVPRGNPAFAARQLAAMRQTLRDGE